MVAAMSISVKPRKGHPDEDHQLVTLIEVRDEYWRVYCPAHSSRCIGKVWKVQINTRIDGGSQTSFQWRTDVSRLPHKTRQAALRELVNLNLETRR